MVTLLAIVASGIMTWRETPQYASRVTLFVSAAGSTSDAASAYQGSLLSEQLVKSYAELLRGQAVASRVVARLGLRMTPDQLSAKIATTTIPDTSLLTATVTDPSPRRAQRIANAVGTEFVALIPTLENTPSRARPAVKVSVVASAQPPSAPVSPRPSRNLLVAGLIGLLLGCALAVARRTFDTSIKTTEQVTEITGAPVLGTVPFDPKCATEPLVIRSRGPRAEALRKVCTSLHFVDVDQPKKVILVTSSVPNEGKTVTACNLAIAMAQADQRVILVDADLRRPDLTNYLGLPNGIGLTNVLIGEVPLSAATQAWGDNLFTVLASGPMPPDPGNLLGSRRMHELLDSLRDSYDTVIVDVPPMLPVADATVTATACDGVLLVVRHGRTRIEQLRTSVNGLRSVEVPILGSVLNLAPPVSRVDYGYRYQYTAPDLPKETAPASASASAHTATDAEVGRTVSGDAERVSTR